MPEPKISIIIPYYNHSDALEQSLESIRLQTYRNYEVIIVDDGSDRPVSQELKTSMDREKMMIIRTENRGAPAARNQGFQVSSGAYVVFWDADVVARPDMLELLIRALEEHSEASYSYCHHRFGSKCMPAVPFDERKLRERNYIHSTALIRRGAVIPWDESLMKFQDWDLWLTMAAEGKVGTLVPEYLFTVRPHRGGMSVWLPRCCYREPFRRLPSIRRQVAAYEQAKRIVMKKHNLLMDNS